MPFSGMPKISAGQFLFTGASSQVPPIDSGSTPDDERRIQQQSQATQFLKQLATRHASPTSPFLSNWFIDHKSVVVEIVAVRSILGEEKAEHVPRKYRIRSLAALG
jgi:hypothetical protein